MSGPEKAYLLSEKGDKIRCLFNPAELTITKTNSWQAAEAKGRNAPEMRFQGGQPGTLTLSLTLDTTDTGGDVTAHTDTLLDLMKVDPELAGSDRQRNSARPPWVEFHWGKLHSFKAIIERMQIRFTYFASSGMPLRAKADLALKQYMDEGCDPCRTRRRTRRPCTRCIAWSTARRWTGSRPPTTPTRIAGGSSPRPTRSSTRSRWPPAPCC